MAIAHWRMPVDVGISEKALDVLGSIGTFIGVAYIGGSVLDYSGFLASIAGKYGVTIPGLSTSTSTTTTTSASAAVTPPGEGDVSDGT